MNRYLPAIRGQRGVGLIEVLVASVVLSIGLLGLAALQSRSLQNNQSSVQRTQAVLLSYFMLDAMRANRGVAVAGNYNLGKTCAVPAEGSTLVSRDRYIWIQALKDNLGNTNTTCGEIACGSATCTVTVYWNDGRATGGDANQSIATSTRL